jgi:putative DNA primase/helicase
MREFEAAQARATLDKSVWAENYKRAAKKKEAAPPKPELEVAEPSQRRLIAVDATFESLHDLMAENPAGVMVLRDELTGWLASLERQGRESERAFYLECWNGDSSFTIDRIGRGSIHVEHCCVSLFGGIQPARLRAYLADALRDGPTNDGLIQRFQLLVWPDTKKDWTYQDLPPDAGALMTAEGAYRRIAELDRDKPLRLKFAPDAQALFVDWLTDLETQLRSDDLSPFMVAHLAKYKKLMPALALLFSIADSSLEAVGLHHAQQAADWCEYLGHHARRVYASRISPERLAAISLGQKLTKGWKRECGTFTVRDVYQNDWSGLGTPDEVRAALRLLEEAGWVRPENPKVETGRPSEVYAVNPKIGGVRAGH